MPGRKQERNKPPPDRSTCSGKEDTHVRLSAITNNSCVHNSTTQGACCVRTPPPLRAPAGGVVAQVEGIGGAEIAQHNAHGFDVRPRRAAGLRKQIGDCANRTRCAGDCVQSARSSVPRNGGAEACAGPAAQSAAIAMSQGPLHMPYPPIYMHPLGGVECWQGQGGPSATLP